MHQSSGNDGPAHSSPRRGITGLSPRSGSVRGFPRSQQSALRFVMKTLRQLVPQLFWAQHDGALWESKSVLDPIRGIWRGVHHQRRDLAAAVALLWIQAASEDVSLSFITIKPDIKPGSKSTYVTQTLRALNSLLRDIRGTRGAWRRFVGTITVTISAAGTPAWAAHPHLHLIAPTALVEMIRSNWEAAAEAAGLPADTRPDGEQRTHPAVKAERIMPGSASLARLVRYLLQARWTNLSPEKASHPLGAIAREGSRMVSRGDKKKGWAWLSAWRDSVVAIKKSRVKVGLDSHRSLKHDADDLVRILELTQRTSSGDVESVINAVLDLQPHMRSAEDLPLALLRREDAEQRTGTEVARTDFSTNGGIRWSFTPGTAPTADLSAAPLVSTRGNHVHSWETSAPLPVTAGTSEGPGNVVVPRARSPPSLHLVPVLPTTLVRPRWCPTHRLPARPIPCKSPSSQALSGRVPYNPLAIFT